MTYAYEFNYYSEEDNTVTILEGNRQPATYNRESLELAIINVENCSFKTEHARRRQLAKYRDALAFLLRNITQNEEPQK